MTSPRDAINVFDFEAAARKKISIAHFGYLSSGADGDTTILANRQGFERYQTRARRLVDVSAIDMSMRLFGFTWNTPILLCPIGGPRAYHAEGEIAAARAAKAKTHSPGAFDGGERVDRRGQRREGRARVVPALSA